MKLPLEKNKLSGYEQISYTMHSRMFEILGYISMMDKNRLSDFDRDYITKIEELCKKMLSEVTLIIEKENKK